MNMTDMLLQMAIQSMWQTAQTSRPTQSSGTQDEQGSSFQDLLEQRRNDVTQTGNETTGPKDPKDEQTAEDAGQMDKESQKEGMVAAAAGSMLLGQLTPVPANFVEETGTAGASAFQTVTMEAMVPNLQEVQVAAQVQAGTALTQEPQEAVQPIVQQAQTPVSDGQTVEGALPQGFEAAVQSAAVQSETQGDQSQDMTGELPQSAASQTDGDQRTDVTVESFQTPLFRETETVPVQVGEAETVDMTAPTQEVEKNLGEILKGALDQGDQHVEIKLSPANLGSVTAEFTRTSEGTLHVVLHAETEQAAKLLSDHAANLGALLQESNRGEVRVQVAQPQENQSAWQQPDQDGGRQQQSQQQQRNTPRQEAESFLQQLRLGLIEMDEENV